MSRLSASERKTIGRLLRKARGVRAPVKKRRRRK